MGEKGSHKNKLKDFFRILKKKKKKLENEEKELKEKRKLIKSRILMIIGYFANVITYPLTKKKTKTNEEVSKENTTSINFKKTNQKNHNENLKKRKQKLVLIPNLIVQKSPSNPIINNQNNKKQEISNKETIFIEKTNHTKQEPENSKFVLKQQVIPKVLIAGGLATHVLGSVSEKILKNIQDVVNVDNKKSNNKTLKENQKVSNVEKINKPNQNLQNTEIQNKNFLKENKETDSINNENKEISFLENLHSTKTNDKKVYSLENTDLKIEDNEIKTLENQQSIKTEDKEVHSLENLHSKTENQKAQSLKKIDLKIKDEKRKSSKNLQSVKDVELKENTLEKPFPKEIMMKKEKVPLNINNSNKNIEPIFLSMSEIKSSASIIKNDIENEEIEWFYIDHSLKELDEKKKRSLIPTIIQKKAFDILSLPIPFFKNSWLSKIVRSVIINHRIKRMKKLINKEYKIEYYNLKKILENIRNHRDIILKNISINKNSLEEIEKLKAELLKINDNSLEVIKANQYLSQIELDLIKRNKKLKEQLEQNKKLEEKGKEKIKTLEKKAR